MFKLSACVYTDNEKAQHATAKVVCRGDGVVAVYAEACAENIHEDMGVRITLSPNVAVGRYMAIYRKCQSWCRPFFGEDLSRIPDNTQTLLLELDNKQYCVIIPVVNDIYKCVVRGDEQGIAAVNTSWAKGLNQCNGLSFVYACGSSPNELMHRCVKAAVELLGNRILLRDQRKYPNVFEYLGWCSWDSMQIRVNEEGILEKCQEFKDKKIPVKWAIFDDMWAEVRDFYGKTYNGFWDMVDLMHASRMYGLDADPYRFPNGLAGCIRKVKDFGLQVGIWYPVGGYWSGFDVEGTAYQMLKDHLMTSITGKQFPNWKYPHSYAYFTAIMRFFRECGADFIKIDNQGIFYRQYKGVAPIGQVASEFHSGLEDAAKEQFNSRMINCMGMASENIWSRSCSPLSRCSGDFMPEDKAWFTQHVLQCAYNSLLQGQLYWCDWDMWWTDDGQAQKNSLMRAVSGGPVYVSDMLQRSRGHVLKPLALENGRILRCDRPGMPTDDCAAIDPTSSGKAMKVQNIAGEHGVMAVINLDTEGKAVTTHISPDQIPGLDAEEYAVYEHFTHSLTMMKKGESLLVELANDDDYRLYIFAPVQNGVAVIGRTDKFISPKAVASFDGEASILTEPGPWAYVKAGKLYKK